MTLNDLVQDVIFENKQESLSVFYDINIFIQNFKTEADKEIESEKEEVKKEIISTKKEDDKKTAGVDSNGVPIEGQLANESINYSLNEDIYKNTKKGEFKIPTEKVGNIQTISDILDLLTDTVELKEDESTIKKVLGKKEFKKTGNKILSTLGQKLIVSILDDNNVSDIISIGDKVVVEVKFGKSKEDNIGFRINKSSGSETLTTLIVKDNKILVGKFSKPVVNKQILYYRNSVQGS